MGFKYGGSLWIDVLAREIVQQAIKAGDNIAIITLPDGTIQISSTGGSGVVAIQDHGVDAPQRSKLDFEGDLTVTDDAVNDRIQISVNAELGPDLIIDDGSFFDPLTLLVDDSTFLDPDDIYS